MDPVEFVYDCEGFDWDKGNLGKSWAKHGVSPYECERAFFNQPLLIFDDETHSKQERRRYALSSTDLGRYLFLVFVIRNKRIRIISARDMNRSERKVYKNYEKRRS